MSDDDHNLQPNSSQQEDKIDHVNQHPETEQENKNHDSPNSKQILDDNLVLQEGAEPCKTVEDYCRTPRSEESKIPRASSCPPAPHRKRRREEIVVSHRRKLEFFEDTVGGAEEIESLFEFSSSADGHVSRASTHVKRRRRSR
ncbi:hypothetical protein DCAR_0415254 [Daucus carota subsp. sativus]|uniref:Cyclin-dependent protein kinase inhibitor SMR2 n=1 Tax=Daucus carota subsp. sativus TaxID=79200 RepID=A0A162A8R4_DAUCS|nr:PREDICTED: cyclin-dependent protein kinase inhibitor SMR2 [Daucus carota subsp. sativus]WOG95925.1 hypothetical protein DCAR_0415254 [Daucus carota subsp. sativus]